VGGDPLSNHSSFRFAVATSGKQHVSPAKKIGIWHFAVVLCLQVPQKCTVLVLSLLYILIPGTYGKYAFLALGVCFPHTFLSAGRRFAASRSRLHYCWQFLVIRDKLFRVETKQFVSSNPNVILTRQTCGKRSSTCVGCTHRALAFWFSVRIAICFWCQNVEESRI